MAQESTSALLRRHGLSKCFPTLAPTACVGRSGGVPRRLLSLQAPKLVWLRIAAGPALQRRAACRRAVANVEAKATCPYEFRKAALLLDLPDLIGPAIA